MINALCIGYDAFHYFLLARTTIHWKIPPFLPMYFDVIILCEVRAQRTYCNPLENSSRNIIHTTQRDEKLKSMCGI